MPPAALVSDQEVHDEENPENLAREPVKDVEERKRKRSWWTILWYTVLTGLGIFFAVIFIKGFIEADDVDVSCGIESVVPECLEIHSSTSKRLFGPP